MNKKPSIVATLTLLAAYASAQGHYTLTNLAATSRGKYYEVLADCVNSSGKVCGLAYRSASSTSFDAVIWSNNVFTDLGLFGYQSTEAIAINTAGQGALDGYGNGVTALFYSNGQATPLTGGITYCFGINKSGNICGMLRNDDGNLGGFSWIGGNFTDLSSVGVTIAAAINDSNTVAGTYQFYYHVGGNYYLTDHAVTYTSAGVYTDLGTLTGNYGSNAEAWAINASGQVVGYSQASDGLEHAFLYSGGSMKDLGTLHGYYAIATAINNKGVIVGNFQNQYGAYLGAFVYTGGKMYDLSSLLRNGSGWSQLTVKSINDSGWIIGNGTFNNITQGFVLKPS